MTWKAAIYIVIPSLLIGCSQENDDVSKEAADANEKKEETNRQHDTPVQDPEEYIGYQDFDDATPFFKMEAPENFVISPDYYTGLKFINFSYVPEDIDYYYEGEDYFFDYAQVATLQMGASEMFNESSEEIFLEQRRSGSIATAKSNDTPYEIIENEEIDPFEFGIMLENESYSSYQFYAAHDGYQLHAQLTVPNNTEEEAIISDNVMEALQTVTFDQPDTWEERPDKTNSEHELNYEPFDSYEPGTIAEDSYTITFPPFPEEFTLTSADPLGLYNISKTYKETTLEEMSGEDGYTHSSIDIISESPARAFTSEQEIVEATEEDIGSWYLEEVKTITPLEDTFEMGDFSQGMHVELNTYEQYFFIRETEGSVIIARYNLIPGTEDYEELKFLYEEAVATFELQ